MTLERAAAVALEKLKELLPQVEAGEQALERGAEHIDTAMTELRGGWDELHEYAGGYEERYRRRTRDVVERQDALARRMDSVARHIADVQDQIGDECEETIGELHALGDEAEEAADGLAQAMERAEEQAERFQRRMRALDERFQVATSALTRFIEDEVQPALERVGDAVEERVQDMCAWLEDAAERSAAGAADVVSGMEAAAGTAAEACGEAGRHAAESALQAAGAAVEHLGAAADTVEQHWADACGALEALDEALDGGAREVDDARERLAALGEEAKLLLDEVADGVSHTLEFFSRFTFL